MVAQQLLMAAALQTLATAQNDQPSEGPVSSSSEPATALMQLGFADANCGGAPVMTMNMVGPSDGQIPSTCSAGSTYINDGTPYIKWDSCTDDIFELSIYADSECALARDTIQVSKDKVVALFSGICTNVTQGDEVKQLRIVSFNGTLPSCQDSVSSCGNFCFNQDLLPDALWSSDTLSDTCNSLSLEYEAETNPVLCQEQRMDYASHCCSGGFFAPPPMARPTPMPHGGDGGDGPQLPPPPHGGDGGDGGHGGHGGESFSAEMQYSAGEPLPLGEFCQSGSFTPEMNLTFVCRNLTALACCNQGGQAVEDQCVFSLSSADAYASTQTICSENGGYEGSAMSEFNTCNTSSAHLEFPGVEWCQRRACPSCSHSWAQQLASVSSCCAAAGTVCDTALPSICADSNTFMPDLSLAGRCDGVSSTDCCAMGGRVQMMTDCDVLRNGTCSFHESAGTAQTDCESAGGTFRPDTSATCQIMLGHMATNNWPSNITDSCETEGPEGSTIADDIMHLVSQGCCGSGASVCSGGSAGAGAGAGAEADLCQVPANFMGSANIMVSCMGLDAATCAGLDGEAEEDMCGEAVVTSCEIMGLAGESAEDRCTTAGGTYSSRGSRSCNEWARGALSGLGSFTEMVFPTGPHEGDPMPCGSVWGAGTDGDLNYHLFRAGGACCSDETSVCMGEDVHVVSAEMTLNMASTAALADDSGQLSSNATAALTKAIADQTGADLSEVTNVTVTVKVKGSAPMELADAAAAQAFVASAEAKLAVEAGLAAQVNVPPASVTATLSLADTATETAVADATVTAAADAAVTTTTTMASRRLTQVEDLRRLQGGGVNVDYEILADLSNSDSMTQSLQAESGSADLTTAINAELATVDGIDPVTVTEISAEPEVTISYQIRTVDAARAQQAQTSIAEASAGGDAQANLMSSINSEMAANGVSVNITGMTVAEPVLEVEDTGDAAAPVSRTDSSGTFRLGCRNFVMAFSAAVAMSLLQL